MKKTAQLLMSAVFCAGAFAQTSTTPPAINQLMLETTLPFSQIGISGATNLPANVIAAITGGALQVRQAVQLVDGENLRIRHLLVAPGAPNPTPAGTETILVEDYLIRINDTIRTTSPGTITFIGTVDRLNAPSPLVGRTGGPAIFSIGYDNSTPRAISNTTLLLPGRGSTWIQSGTGTLTLEGDATDPGEPGENRPPVANVGASDRLTIAQSEIFLDASGSTDPDEDELTYSWRVVRGPALIVGGSTMARIRVQLSGNATENIFELTVTDSEGAKSTATLTVLYTGPF